MFLLVKEQRFSRSKAFCQHICIIYNFIISFHHIVLGEEGVAFFSSIVFIGLDILEADEGLLVEEMTTGHHRRNYPS